MKTADSRPMLALIVGIFALPFAVAAGLFAFGWQPTHTVNHGQLIRPPLPLPPHGLTTADGAPLATAELHGRWWLLLAQAGPCDTACLARAADMRRVHVALNKDMGRLKRLVLATDLGEGAIAALRRSQPDLVVARADGRWQQVLGDGPQLYLVDPQGRAILRYTAQASAESIRADLDRLLRYGSAG